MRSAQGLVASKEFVASVARQRYAHLLTSHLRHQIGGNLRGVRERLAEHRPEPWYQLKGVVFTDD